jgi:hypothetical protein
VLNNTVMRFFGVKQWLWDFLTLTLLKQDISKPDHWKNVSDCIGLLILNFFILNGEILTELIWDFEIPVFLEQFLIPRFWDLRLSTFSISPMPGSIPFLSYHQWHRKKLYIVELSCAHGWRHRIHIDLNHRYII